MADAGARPARRSRRSGAGLDVRPANAGPRVVVEHRLRAVLLSCRHRRHEPRGDAAMIMADRHRSRGAIVVVGVTIGYATLLTAAAAAQTNERIYEDLDFRFVTPGARAVGMGKTFVGLADDATAAESNPAGMSNLLEQEFSVEFIGTQIKHKRFVPGGTPPTETFGEYVTTPSFLSYVLPMKRWTVSFYRHTVQDY